jgi:hypothetical protein
MKLRSAELIRGSRSLIADDGAENDIENQGTGNYGIAGEMPLGRRVIGGEERFE